jgi:hypothetical protein
LRRCLPGVRRLRPEFLRLSGTLFAATEPLGDVYYDLYGLDVVSLRITEVYGPGNKMPQVVKEMAGSAVRGGPYRLEECGNHPFRLIHAEGVAREQLQMKRGGPIVPSAGWQRERSPSDPRDGVFLGPQLARLFSISTSPLSVR